MVLIRRIGLAAVAFAVVAAAHPGLVVAQGSAASATASPAGEPSPSPTPGLPAAAVPGVTSETPGAAAAVTDPDFATAPLEGTTWRLRHFRWRGAERTAGPEVAAWMTLRAGTLTGSGGCDRLRGRYGRMGDALRVTLQDTPPPDCAEQAALVQLALIEGLREASTFEIAPSDEPLAAELSLRDPAGTERLRFEVDDVASLVDETWQLTSYTMAGQTRPAAASQTAVLDFGVDGGSRVRRRSEGDVVGSSGCNGIVGTYSRAADLLQVRDLETTPAPCTSELAAQEDAMLAVLDSRTLRIELPPDRLVLTSTETGDRLDFAAAATLEGSTWLLAGIADRASTDALVTFRLDQGVVQGEGPCGPYTGSYVTDGLFIRFGDLRGSGTEDCPERRQQRALLGALERSALLDRDQPQLRMLDAAGKLTARFRRPIGP